MAASCRSEGWGRKPANGRVAACIAASATLFIGACVVAPTGSSAVAGRSQSYTLGSELTAVHADEHGGGMSYAFLHYVDCPAQELCAASTQVGSVVTSGNPFTTSLPTREDGTSTAWNEQTKSRFGERPRCTALPLCLMARGLPGAQVSGVRISLQPGTQPVRWRTVRLPLPPVARRKHLKGPPAGLIACPRADRCVVMAAGNGNPGMFTWWPRSVDEWGYAKRWRQDGRMFARTYMTDATCPDPTFCVAVGTHGAIAVLRHPLNARARWKLGGLRSRLYLNRVICPVSRLCIAVSSFRQTLFVSNNPRLGAGSWRRLPQAPMRIQDISCPSVHFCAFTGSNLSGSRSFMYVSTKAGASPAEWQEVVLPDPRYDRPYAVSCPVDFRCVVTDGETISLLQPSPETEPGASMSSAWATRGVPSGAVQETSTSSLRP